MLQEKCNNLNYFLRGLYTVPDRAMTNLFKAMTLLSEPSMIHNQPY